MSHKDFGPIKDDKHMNLLLSTVDVVSNYFPEDSTPYKSLQASMLDMVRHYNQIKKGLL